MKTPATTSELDLAGAYRAYLGYLDVSPRTAQTYTSNLKQFFKWLQSLGIKNPGRQEVLAYRDSLKQRCKPTTVQSYITALRLFFSWTAQEGLYPNIAEHIKGAKIEQGHKKDYLAGWQVKSILDEIDTATARGKRDFCIIALMATGGLRDIEVARARIGDIQQKGAGTVLYLQGKGREEKTDYIRIVPDVEKPLRSYLATRREAGEDLPIFVSYSNNSRGHGLTPKSISEIVKNRFRAAGYNSPKLTAHSLRHTAVTLSLIGGRSLHEVQQFARHKSIATTLIYAHDIDRENNQSEATIAEKIFQNRHD